MGMETNNGVGTPSSDINVTPLVGEALVIGLGERGAIYLNGEHLSGAEELRTRLSRVLAARERKVVFVDFDDRAIYGDAIEVLDVAKQSGASVLGIMSLKGGSVPDTLQGA
jgi:biopolymer transport protein ExbD